MRTSPIPVPWLQPGEAFPPVSSAWGPQSPAPGLLASGGTLSKSSLLAAYSQGVFPWYSPGQPVLWWSPNPRMVLPTTAFKVHRSLRKKIKSMLISGQLRVSFDEAFGRVIRACAHQRRDGQTGTWIVPDMVTAYEAMHAAGYAHSVETWFHNELVGGLYCINLGHMVFGESMFSDRSDASKIALAGLVAFARAHQLPMIDCQQNTSHLASLGASEMDRSAFVAAVRLLLPRPAPKWRYDPIYWHFIPGIV